MMSFALKSMENRLVAKSQDTVRLTPDITIGMLLSCGTLPCGPTVCGIGSISTVEEIKDALEYSRRFLITTECRLSLGHTA